MMIQIEVVRNSTRTAVIDYHKQEMESYTSAILCTFFVLF